MCGVVDLQVSRLGVCVSSSEFGLGSAKGVVVSIQRNVAFVTRRGVSVSLCVLAWTSNRGVHLCVCVLGVACVCWLGAVLWVCGLCAPVACSCDVCGWSEGSVYCESCPSVRGVCACVWLAVCMCLLSLCLPRARWLLSVQVSEFRVEGTGGCLSLCLAAVSDIGVWE